MIIAMEENPYAPPLTSLILQDSPKSLKLHFALSFALGLTSTVVVICALSHTTLLGVLLASTLFILYTTITVAQQKTVSLLFVAAYQCCFLNVCIICSLILSEARQPVVRITIKGYTFVDCG